VTRIDGLFADPSASQSFFNISTNTVFVLGQLESFVNYSVSVITVTVSSGPPSIPVACLTQATAPEGAPLATTVDFVDDGLSAAWEAPVAYLQNGPITEYTVQYERAVSTNFGDGTVITAAMLGGPATVVFNVSLPTLLTPSYVAAIPPVGQPALTPFCDYVVRIKSVNYAGQGPFSAAVLNRTTPAVPNGPPTDIAGSALNGTSIMVNWTLPFAVNRRGVVLSYLVVLARIPNQPSQREGTMTCPAGFSSETADECRKMVSRTVGQELLSLPIEDLQPYYNYTVQVAAINPAGLGSLSAPIPIQTKIAAPSGTVASPSALPVSSSQITVSWMAPLLSQRNGPIIAYYISVARLPNQPIDTAYPDNPLVALRLAFLTPEIFDSPTRSYNVFGLQPDTIYRVTLSAVTSVGTGPELTVDVRTREAPPSGPPLDFVATVHPLNGPNKTILLSWSPPEPFLRNGVLLDYLVTYQYNDARLVPTVGPLKSLNVSDITVLIEGLLPFVNYHFTVTASTARGVSTFSASQSAETDTSLPTGGPPAVSFTAGSSSCVSQRCLVSVLVTWEDPSPFSMGAPAMGYTVLAYAAASSQNDLSVDSALPLWTQAQPQRLSPSIAELSRTYNAARKVFVNTYTVSNLQSVTDYIIDVALVNTVDEGPFTSSAVSRTAAAGPTGPPLNVVLNSTYNSVIVQFKPPLTFLRHGFITAFRFTITRYPTEYFLNGGGSAVRNSPALTTSSTIGFTSISLSDNAMLTATFNSSILAFTSYSVIVSAFGTGQFGPDSSPVFVVTKPRAPDRPPTPVVGTVSPTTIRLSWPTLGTKWGFIRRIQVVVEPQISRLYRSCNSSSLNCSDGLVNNYETGVDCGGDCPLSCNILAASAPTLPLAMWSSSLSNAYVTFQQDFPDGTNNTAGQVVVGDSLSYGGVYNGPLAPVTSYHFRLLAYTGLSTTLATPSDSSCANGLLPLATTAAVPTTQAPDTSGSGGGGGGGGMAFAGAGAGGAIIVVIIIIIVLRRRKQQTEKESDEATTDTLTPVGSKAELIKPAAKQKESKKRRSTMERANNLQRPNASSSSSPLASSAVAAALSIGIKLAPVKRNEITLENLPDVIARLSINTNLGFAEEFENLETGKEFPREVASLPVNKTKNRYANILPYDHSRVTLSIINGDKTSDYINASFVDGYSVPRHYIAAQGPTEGTTSDFWRMMWESKVCFIIMLTNLEEKGRIKCFQYWPGQLRSEMKLACDLSVSLTAEEEFPDYIVRTLSLQCGSDTRIVRQFHYISWPDHGVPDSTMTTISILRKVRAARTPGTGPLLVHCSAGVGRTGTVIAVDYNMDKANKSGTVDVLGCLNDMRRQRSTVVQTEDQYIFCYLVLADACKPFAVDLDPSSLRRHVQTLNDRSEGVSLVESEFKMLGDVSAAGTLAYRYDAALQACNREKNRFQQFKPYDHTRVKLNGIPGILGSDYINASWISGYEQARAFICTQGPLDNTIIAFWEMIWESESNAIVMLSALREDGHEHSAQYWPDADESPMMFGSFEVHLREERDLHWVIERSFSVVDTVSGHNREVRHWQFTAWPEKGLPSSGRSLVELVRLVRDFSRRAVVLPQESIYGNQQTITDQSVRPIVVHCSNGINRSGVYCALASGIRRLEDENRVDLYSIVKHMRTQRAGMMSTVDFYLLTYRCLIDHLDMPMVSSAPSTTTALSSRRAPPPVPLEPVEISVGGSHNAWSSDDTPTTALYSPPMMESSFMEDDFGFDAPPSQENFGFLDEAA